jgi:hypothetical protein
LLTEFQNKIVKEWRNDTGMDFIQIEDVMKGQLSFSDALQNNIQVLKQVAETLVKKYNDYTYATAAQEKPEQKEPPPPSPHSLLIRPRKVRIPGPADIG